MDHLFDHSEKLVRFNRELTQQLQIQHVFDPHTQSFIDVQLAHAFGIVSNGFYQHRNEGWIPLHSAASRGLIKFIIHDQSDCEEMEIEYRPRRSPIISTLCIRLVYDQRKHCLMTFREAIDQGYLDTDLFQYSCSNLSMPIHDAFYRGLIIGELRTSISEQTLPEPRTETEKLDSSEQEGLFAVLTNLLDSLREFISTIYIADQCQLTTNGYIQDRQSGQCYLMTQAIELGLITFFDC